MANTIDMSQFYAVFFAEAAEHLAEMERLLLAIDPASPGDEELNAVFRAAHSIKGGAGTFGFKDMAETMHEAETLLDRVRKHELALTREMVDALLEAGDVIGAQLARHRGEGGDEVDASGVVARLKALEGQKQEQKKEDAGYGFFDDVPAPAKNWGRRATDNPEVISAPAGRRTNDKVVVSPNGDSSSIRVSVEKVDQLINLVGELVITQAMLAQRAGGRAELANGMADLERNTRDLQESVMSIRMLPMAFVFNRFPRMLRDLAAKLGKQVELKTVGEQTELDKGVIEKIADPMTHLVRNAVDHGIESPEARLAAGKPAQGTLTLRAFHQGGNIVIEVADDGRGLDRKKLLQKAKEKNLSCGDSMSDQEVFQLIFEPGFSTAAEITDVSGRGVGMDVVKKNITALGGSVELDSALGAGTRVTVRLPLTLAIMDGLSIRVTGETYVVPLASVVELLEPGSREVKTVSGRGKVVDVRSEFLPVVSLSEKFLLGEERKPDHACAMVIVESEGAKTALLVDELLGQQQVVVKSLEANYKRVPGISGATIMGDGSVALIADVTALVRRALH
jgi:two-component system chemotaxis sensor kinase CheA